MATKTPDHTIQSVKKDILHAKTTGESKLIVQKLQQLLDKLTDNV